MRCRWFVEEPGCRLHDPHRNRWSDSNIALRFGPPLLRMLDSGDDRHFYLSSEGTPVIPARAEQRSIRLLHGFVVAAAIARALSVH
jgi:hypothetical protein